MEYLNTLKGNLEGQKAPIQREILNELGNINLNSPKQLLEALNEKGIFPSLKGKPSTDKRALEYKNENPWSNFYWISHNMKHSCRPLYTPTLSEPPR